METVQERSVVAVERSAHDGLTRLLVEALYVEADASVHDDLAHRAFHLARLRLEARLAEALRSPTGGGSVGPGTSSERAAVAALWLRALLDYVGATDSFGSWVIEMGAKHFEERVGTLGRVDAASAKTDHRRQRT